jgi:hypothetical protein
VISVKVSENVASSCLVTFVYILQSSKLPKPGVTKVSMCDLMQKQSFEIAQKNIKIGFSRAKIKAKHQGITHFYATYNTCAS